jgi:DNA-directed RNA polymerase subunit RPC12/RpoP
MATKKRGSGTPAGVPLGVLFGVGHVVYDLASHASCPNCGSQVVLYICTGCKRPVRPNRGRAAA